MSLVDYDKRESKILFYFYESSQQQTNFNYTFLQQIIRTLLKQNNLVSFMSFLKTINSQWIMKDLKIIEHNKDTFIIGGKSIGDWYEDYKQQFHTLNPDKIQIILKKPKRFIPVITNEPDSNITISFPFKSKAKFIKENPLFSEIKVQKQIPDFK